MSKKPEYLDHFYKERLITVEEKDMYNEGLDNFEAYHNSIVAEKDKQIQLLKPMPKCLRCAEVLDNTERWLKWCDIRVLELYEAEQVKVAEKDEDIKRLKDLLKLASKMINHVPCVQGCNQGVLQLSEYEIVQCQWCDEKNKIDQALKETGGKE